MVIEIKWPPKAQQQLETIYKNIVNASYQNAEKVRDEILKSTKGLIKNPKKYPADKYKKNNDGTFRAYEIMGYRISYKITNAEIIIVRIRPTRMRTVQY